jgi:hypothetical protein
VRKRVKESNDADKTKECSHEENHVPSGKKEIKVLFCTGIFSGCNTSYNWPLLKNLK